MTVFVVISYDAEEQQTFWDTVPAESEDNATEIIDRLRPYAVVVDVLNHDLVRSVADDMLTCAVEEAAQRLRELEADAALE